MSKRSQKVLASATILSLVMSTVAMAAPTAGTAVSGTSRVDTAIAIAQKAYSKWTDSKVAIIANGANDHLVDALSVAPLAYQKKAPIFYTMGTGTIEDSVISAIKAQGVNTVYVVGGAVTSAVDAQLKAAGVATVTHLAGSTRFETAKAINTEFEKAGAPAGYAVVNGYGLADALSIAAQAANQGLEIVLASDANTADVPAGAKKVYAVGGAGVLSDALVTKLNATRFGGDSRFATNASVLKNVSGVDFTTTYVADGTDEHLVDSLAGSVLAAQTASPIVLVNNSVDAAAVDVLKANTSKMTTVTPLGGAVNKDAVAVVVDPSKATTTTPTTALAVSSVSATAADTITVQFNQAPADTSKVAFTVNRSTTPFAVTTSWNGSVATLKYSSNLPTGDYTVAVKNDTADLGTSKLTIDQQKIAKIEINTEKFATDNTGKTGFFTYKVLDQYGVDITNTKSSSIQWTVPGVDAGSIKDSSGTKGVITATVGASSSFNFLNLGSVSVTGVDTSDNIVVTKTLSVSAAVGTLSEFKLLGLAETTPLRAGDNTTVWHINYEAKDLSGNDTTNYTLIEGGLIDQESTTGDGVVVLNTSGYISAKVINKDGKGVIELRVTSDDALASNVPVIITAITKNGSTSPLNLTLNKKLQVTKMNIYAPTEDICYGEAKEIPFEAYDQDGNQVTKFTDIVDENSTPISPNKFTKSKYNNITLSPLATSDTTSEGFYWVKRGDDTAKLMYRAPQGTATANDTTRTLTASTNTGNYCPLTISVRKIANADSLALDDSSIIKKVVTGGIIDVDQSLFTAKDNYGRKKTLDVNSGYYLTAEIIGNAASYTTSASIEILGNDNESAAPGSTTAKATQYNSDGTTRSAWFLDFGNDLYIKGSTTPGTTTVKFTLNDGVKGVAVASKTVDFTSISESDVAGLTIATPAKLFDVYKSGSSAAVETTTGATGVGVGSTYESNSVLYGLDDSGNKVVLPQKALVISVSNGDLYKYAQTTGLTTFGDAGDANKVNFGAWADKATSSTVVTVSTPINGSIKAATVTVDQSEEVPVAQSIVGNEETAISDYPTSKVITDAVNVKDQYGKNMLKRLDGSVKIYVGPTLQTDPAYAKNTKISSLPVGTVLTFIASNGMKFTTVIKQ